MKEEREGTSKGEGVREVFLRGRLTLTQDKTSRVLCLSSIHLPSSLLATAEETQSSSIQRKKGRKGETAQVVEVEGRKGGSLCSNSNAGTSNKEEDGSRSVALESRSRALHSILNNS